jgi:hypothetical protein
MWTDPSGFVGPNFSPPACPPILVPVIFQVLEQEIWRERKVFQLLSEVFSAAVCDNSRYGCGINFTVIAAAFGFRIVAFRHEAGFECGIGFIMTLPDDVFVSF